MIKYVLFFNILLIILAANIYLEGSKDLYLQQRVKYFKKTIVLSCNVPSIYLVPDKNKRVVNSYISRGLTETFRGVTFYPDMCPSGEL